MKFSNCTLCGILIDGGPKRCPACVAKVNNSKYRREWAERKAQIEANEFNRLVKYFNG